jgi:hypothetical protein
MQRQSNEAVLKVIDKLRARRDACNRGLASRRQFQRDNITELSASDEIFHGPAASRYEHMQHGCAAAISTAIR